jgi:hypothetical protein
MLPNFRHTGLGYIRGGKANLDAFLPGLHLDSSSNLHGRIQNPWLASGESIPFYRILGVDSVDCGYRAISKFGRVHFRFDDRGCADEWCTGFERTAARHLAATPAEMMQYYFEAALKVQMRVKAPEKPIKTSKGSMTYQW